MSKSVIAFAGRLQSGKTELAKICEEFGYKRLSVATPLKRFIAELLSCTIEDVNRLKTVNKAYIFDDEDQEYIAYVTQIPIDIIKEKVANKTFANTREIMQFIGTELIRAYNSNWHVNELRKLMKDDNKYVIDDIRFPNELALVEEMGGTCWFVVRPVIGNVINHESETSLKWQDFDNIIINDSSLEYLQWNWRHFMENGYEESLSKRKELWSSLHGDKQKIIEFLTSTDTFTILDAHFISKWEFTYNSSYVNRDGIKSITQNKQFVTVSHEDGVEELIKNPLVIEDLKIYL